MIGMETRARALLREPPPPPQTDDAAPRPHTTGGVARTAPSAVSMTAVEYARTRDILRDVNFHPVTPTTDAEVAKYSIRLRKLLQLYKAEGVGDAPASMLLTTQLAAIPEYHQIWMYRKAFPTETHDTMPDVTISEFSAALFKAFAIHRAALLPQVQSFAPLTFFTSREANYTNVSLLATNIAGIAAV